MIGLTARQREVCQAIERHQQEHGYPPTVRELMAALGIASTNGVSDHLRAIAAKGYLRHDATRSRALVLTEAWHGGPVAAQVARLEREIAERQSRLDALRAGHLLTALAGPTAGVQPSALRRGRPARCEAGKGQRRGSNRHVGKSTGERGVKR